MDNIYCHVVATLYITFSRIFYEYECVILVIEFDI